MDATALKEENERLKEECSRLRKHLEQNKRLSDSFESDEEHAKSIDLSNTNDSYVIVVLGASGDLAKKKTFPALFHLYRYKLIPQDTLIFGYARSEMSIEDFHSQISETFKDYGEDVDKFLKQCHYFRGNYDSVENLSDFSKKLEEQEKKLSKESNNRIFYMALPPSIFLKTAEAIKKSIMSKSGWNRVIVEKPFGNDLETFIKLNESLSTLFTENELYRIDHYLGKEMVQNLMILRFANSMFEPIWNSHYVSNVKITFKEDFGIQGRAGYFDSFGIIRDVMQNHLMQILALIAMESPISLSEEDIRDEKVKVVKSIVPLKLEDIVVGQYGENKEKNAISYLDEEGVPKDSITPTFTLAVLKINNTRWNGVPFILKCGKNLEEKKAEIRIQFKRTATPLFGDVPPNELVYVIQPNEAIYMKMMSKVPGLTNDLTQTELDLSYKKRFSSGHVADAYERLLLDVFRGDRSLFVRADELAASWKVFTPILQKLESQRIKPIVYPSLTRGPKEADELSEKHGWRRYEGYKWPKIPSHL